MNKIMHLILGTSLVAGPSLVVGTAVAFAYSDTKSTESTAKIVKPRATTNRMEKQPPPGKHTSGTQTKSGPAGSGNKVGTVVGSKVDSTFAPKGLGGSGNKNINNGKVYKGNGKNIKGSGNSKFNQNTVGNAGNRLGGSHGDDTPTETGIGGTGGKSTSPAKTTKQ